YLLRGIVFSCVECRPESTLTHVSGCRNRPGSRVFDAPPFRLVGRSGNSGFDTGRMKDDVRALAARSAQVLYVTDVVRDLGLAVNAVKAWISVLGATYQIITLRWKEL